MIGGDTMDDTLKRLFTRVDSLGGSLGGSLGAPSGHPSYGAGEWGTNAMLRSVHPFYIMG